MRLKTVSRLTLIIVLVGLTACTAFHLRDANEQLTSYYYAKQQAENNKDWRMLENTIVSLSKLADDSVKQAEKEKDNVLNQIAFYRIAATAAWLAEVVNVITYADEGQRLCEGDNFNRAPRDCGLLLVIPTLAGVDETTKRFNRLQAKVTASNWEKNPEDEAELEKIYLDYVFALKSLLSRRPNLQMSGANPDFLKGVDKNIETLLCKNIDEWVLGLIPLTSTEERVSALECEVYKLKEMAFNAGLTKPSVGCLPENKDQLIELRRENCQ
jgi:hypothetical protein